MKHPRLTRYLTPTLGGFAFAYIVPELHILNHTCETISAVFGTLLMLYALYGVTHDDE